jgi:hypothetical protein
MKMNTHLLAWAGFLMASGLTATATRADVLDTQSNRVSDDFAGSYWYNPDAWAAIPRYAADPIGDASPVDGYDWFYTQIAHDDNYLYLHYYNSHNFAGDRQITYLDADSDPNTGSPGFTGTLAVGAEYFVSGAAWNVVNPDGSINFAGWTSWNNLQDGEGNWHILVAAERSALIPGVTSFNFVNQNHDQSGDDWYPNAGNTFPGDYFRYEIVNPTVEAFGRTWDVYEPTHRDNPNVSAGITGASDTLTMTGVFGGYANTRAITALTVGVGTKVSYDFALTHDQVDRAGDGTLEAWVDSAWGAFTNNGSDASNANLTTTRVGATPYDDEATRIQYNDISAGEEGFASLLDSTGTAVEHHLTDGVHIEWLFTSETTVAVSVFSGDGVLLGPTFIDTISNVADIQGFRFNLFDSEQTMNVSDFLVEEVVAGLPGDYNVDGSVDAADYTVWRDADGLSVTTPGEGADGNSDGVVDAADYNLWVTNYGVALPVESPVAVPEPAAVLLASLVFAAASGTRNRVW